MSRASNQFSSVKTEGGLLPQDMLARIQAGDPVLLGMKAETYHLGANERIGEATNQAWSRLVSSWHAFQEALAKESDDAPATGLTRDRWLLPLFEILGYGRLPKGTAIEVEGKSYAVSHTWHHSPIHLLGCRVDLDTRQKGVAGAAMSSPHGLVQDFLNRSDAHLWGFVTNGYQLRVLRDHHSLTRQAYVEFDLQAIMDGEQYSEFLLLWLVCHQSRVEADKPEECWLETWVNISRDEGVRALDKLRDGVEQSIEAFGTGFLAHKANTRLKAALESGELDGQEYYRQILRLVYRLIFLFVAEERDALLDPNATEEARERYRRYYATRRIRDLADKRRGSPHGDLWRGIALVMEKLDDGYPELGLPALGSMLWGKEACPWLMDAECANDHVLSAVRLLSHIQDGKTRYPVNWRNVGADELGSIYESLLERHPRIHKEAATFELETAAGNDRKTTGSYYTPTSLVDCLLDSALQPVLDEASKETDPEQAILALTVCDPACGSGHFLVAAARRIAKRLASVRSGDDEPSPQDVQRALRDVVGHCLYGVDLNPMAVELCKVSLWLEAIEPGKPLSFLDHKIQLGNSLLGTTPALLAEGVPNAAFKPIAGDDKEVAKLLARQNRSERGGQTSLLPLMAANDEHAYGDLSDKAQALESIADDDIKEVRRKQTLHEQLKSSEEYRTAKQLADAWCVSFLGLKTQDAPAAITEETLRRLREDPKSASGEVRSEIDRLADQYHLFHWHIAYPDVFQATEKVEDAGNSEMGWDGGFSVLLGNPPWERIKLQEKEWFATRDPEIAKAPNAAARRKMIAALAKTDPPLYEAFLDAGREAEGSSHLIRNSGRFPLCGRGDVNTYTIFAENMRNAISPTGRVGCVVPSGIATDDTTKFFFQDIVERGSLASLYDFENRLGIFPGVHSSMKFCLLTVAGLDRPVTEGAEFSFFAHEVADLKDPERRFRLSAEDIELLNPNTRTCPIFRTQRDAEITKKIFQRVPVLLREGPPELNPWDVQFARAFDMSNDSGLFNKSTDLEPEGWTLSGNVFRKNGDRQLPLYEAKMAGSYDHRAADVVISATAVARQGQPDALSLADHEDPARVVLPRAWVGEDHVDDRLAGKWEREWLLCWRDITSATNERTLIAGVIPRSAVGNNLPIALLMGDQRPEQVCLGAVLSSFACDFAARFKVGGTHVNFFIFEQIPVLPPEVFRASCAWAPSATVADWITKRVLELTYTAWDLSSFGRDCGYDGTPFRWSGERRAALRCELDAAFFHLYGIEREDIDYIMETFPIVKRKDVAANGDYRTKLQILEIYDAMQKAVDGGNEYKTILKPAPADHQIAHPESSRPNWVQANR